MLYSEYSKSKIYKKKNHKIQGALYVIKIIEILKFHLKKIIMDLMTIKLLLSPIIPLENI